MKCINCKEKFPTKHTSRCKNLQKNICLRCALEGYGLHSCDLKCPDGSLPVLSKVFPLTTGVAGHSPMGETRTTTEEFIPRIFHFLSCTDVTTKITIKSLRLLKVELEFALRGKTDLSNHLYYQEYWKTRHLEDLLKEIGLKVDYPVAPVFGVSLDEGLRVIKESIKSYVDEKEILIIANDTCELVGLPDCEPPLTNDGKLRHSGYSYFGGKFTVFYTHLLVNKTYKITFNLEALNFFYEIGFLLPFRFLKWKEVQIISESPEVIVARRRYRVLSPIRIPLFPPRQEYEWGTRGDVSGKYPPMLTIADPFRRHPLAGLTRNTYEIQETQALNKIYGDYEMLEMKINFGTPKDRSILTHIQITESPLPVRIYDQLQKLPRYRNFLISYDIINFSDNTISLEITSEIIGITDPAIDNIQIPGKNDKGTKRKILTQCPLLKFGVLSRLSRETKATLKYKVMLKGKSGRVLEQGTKIVELLPQDMIIWNMTDQKSNTVYDLSPMIGSWISPTDDKGILDKIRGEAAKYHPDGFLAGNQGTTSLEDITSQVKAIYEYLNNKFGIRYVNQAFSHGFNSGGQRVVLSERVLNAKCGNCIDLVVLFSSLMEGLGFNPLILLTQDHAFLAWGNKYKTSEMDFLECTTLGLINPKTREKYTFDEASDMAEKYFKDHFLLIGSEDYLPLHSVIMNTKHHQIVDLEDIRKQGIYRS